MRKDRHEEANIRFFLQLFSEFAYSSLREYVGNSAKQWVHMWQLQSETTLKLKDFEFSQYSLLRVISTTNIKYFINLINNLVSLTVAKRVYNNVWTKLYIRTSCMNVVL